MNHGLKFLQFCPQYANLSISELLNICFISVVQFQELIGLGKKFHAGNKGTKH